MKIGVFHYWLVNWRGGEKVLAEILNALPPADLYSHVTSADVVRKTGYDPDSVRHTPFARLPGAVKNYKMYSPFCYLASMLVDSTRYQLIVSSESGPIKGLRRGKNSVHVCYCHSPFRILWVSLDWYGEKLGPWKYLFGLLRLPLRVIDRWTARSVDCFIANSSYIQNRILQVYQRESIVIHPPVELSRFNISEEKGDYFLWLGELVSYKRPDLVVEAFNRNGLSLVVAGQGEMQDKLRSGAAENIRFVGRVDDDELPALLSHARALVFAGIEDFGIVFVEALASGTPVIALGEGGVRDIVADLQTGVFFSEQSVIGVQSGLEKFLAHESVFDPAELNKSAQKFGPERFQLEFHQVVNEELQKRGMSSV